MSGSQLGHFPVRRGGRVEGPAGTRGGQRTILDALGAFVAFVLFPAMSCMARKCPSGERSALIALGKRRGWIVKNHVPHSDRVSVGRAERGFDLGPAADADELDEDNRFCWSDGRAAR